MSKKAKDAATAAKACEIAIETGDRLVIPDGIDYEAAIAAVKAKRDDQFRMVKSNEAFDCWFFEGWYEFSKALVREFGKAAINWVIDTQVDIHTGPNTSTKVTWGPFRIRGRFADATFYPQIVPDGAKYVISIEASMENRFRPEWAKFCDTVREDLKRKGGLYRGKALRITPPEPGDEPTMQNAPVFLDLSVERDEVAIFNDALADAIDVSVFTPVRHTKTCESLGISLRQGVLLCGLPGTGKSLTGRMLARECVQHGWTFLMVTAPNLLAEGLRMARGFAPHVVVFCEDIDLAMSGEHRTHAMNEVLCAMDGLEPNNAIMTVLTSNKPEQLHSALVRGRRLDAILKFEPPDADTVKRLIREFTPSLAPDADLTAAGEILAGLIPATIMSICSRARMAAARHGAGTVVTARDLETVARQARAEFDLVHPRTDPAITQASAIVKVAEAIARLGEPAEPTSEARERPNGAKRHGTITTQA